MLQNDPELFELSMSEKTQPLMDLVKHHCEENIKPIQAEYSALQNEVYTCFLQEDRALPMMYMDDAVRATVQLMEAPKENITVRSSYNLGGVSFKPTDIARAIRKRIKDFDICYQPDFRDEIAQSWPHSIDDQDSQKDWNWKNKYELEEIVEVMLHNLSEKLQLS